MGAVGGWMAYVEHMGSRVHIEPMCLVKLTQVQLPRVNFLTYRAETL